MVLMLASPKIRDRVVGDLLAPAGRVLEVPKSKLAGYACPRSIGRPVLKHVNPLGSTKLPLQLSYCLNDRPFKVPHGLNIDSSFAFPLSTILASLIGRPTRLRISRQPRAPQSQSSATHICILSGNLIFESSIHRIQLCCLISLY